GGGGWCGGGRGGGGGWGDVGGGPRRRAVAWCGCAWRPSVAKGGRIQRKGSPVAGVPGVKIRNRRGAADRAPGKDGAARGKGRKRSLQVPNPSTLWTAHRAPCGAAV